MNLAPFLYEPRSRNTMDLSGFDGGGFARMRCSSSAVARGASPQPQPPSSTIVIDAAHVIWLPHGVRQVCLTVVRRMNSWARSSSRGTNACSKRVCA